MPEYSDVMKIGSKRLFIQPGGPGPANALKFTGVDAQYMALKGGKRPVRGGVDPIFTNDPLRAGEYVLVGTKSTPPALPTATIELYEKIGTLPFSYSDLLCPLNVYMTNGLCKDPSSFDTGWDGYLEVWGMGKATDVDYGDRSSNDGMDDPLKDSISYVWRRAYALGSLLLGQQSSAVTVREVVDIVMASNLICADCGADNDGSKWQYAIHKENSGVAAAAALYSTDYGVTWTSQAITGMANTETPTGIAVVGDKLVIVSPTGTGANQSALYYTTINQATGVPGAAWSKVGTGFDTGGGKLGRDIFVLSPREVFISGDAGYIYKSTDVTAGVSIVSAAGATTAALGRITGAGEVLVAVGATGKVVKSTNRGSTWALTTTDPSGNTLNAVAIKSASEFWVGDASGGVFYTLDGGETWTAKTMPATLAAVQDIVWATPEAGYITATVAGPLGRLLASTNGGQSWVISSNIQPRLLNLPTTVIQRYNRIAVPEVPAGLTKRGNTLSLAGLGAVAAGVIFTGRANDL